MPNFSVSSQKLLKSWVWSDLHQRSPLAAWTSLNEWFLQGHRQAILLWSSRQAHEILALPILCSPPYFHFIHPHYAFSFALNGGGRSFLSPSSPLSSLLCSLVSLRDSLCTALQTKRLWIWSTGLLMQLTLSETWVSGNLTAPTERSQRAIRWTRGRGGESCVLRLFPWRTLKISTYSEPW